MARHVSMPELQKLLGRSSIVTTSDYYVDLSDDVAEKVRGAFTASLLGQDTLVESSTMRSRGSVVFVRASRLIVTDLPLATSN